MHSLQLDQRIYSLSQLIDELDYLLLAVLLHQLLSKSLDNDRLH